MSDPESPHPDPIHRRDDSVELASVVTDDSDMSNQHTHHEASSPDSPLMAATDTQPAWLRSRRSRPWPAWLSTVATYLAAKLRPRLTWRYVLFSILVLYYLYCVVTGSPLLASKLPDYSEKYRVGALDLEVPLEKPIKISDTTLKVSGEPAFEVETVLFTVYYPIDKGVHSKRPKHLWFPRPISLTAEGYATLAHANNFLTRPIFTFALWAIGGSITIPAEVDVPLLPKSVSNDPLPVIVFSHGMASSRTDYTHYLGQLASAGYVVAAVEHRDGSCPGTIVTLPGKPERRILPLREKDLVSEPKMDTPRLKREQLAFREVPGKPERRILPLREKDLVSEPKMDTPRLKREQLAFREAEIYETAHVLETLNNGAEVNTTRSEHRALPSFKGRLDMKQLIISGHSYGATGAMQALKPNASSTFKAVGGVILDPGKSSGRLNEDIDVPILIIHSNSWSATHSVFYGRPHFSTVRDIAKSVLARTSQHASWFFTSLGTSHPSVTDAPLLEPLLLSWTTGASIDVYEGLAQYVRVTKEFLGFLEGEGRGDGLLNEPVTHEEYGEWISQERKKQFPKKLAKYWEVHVSAAGEKA